jgi:hypothetical protein
MLSYRGSMTDTVNEWIWFQNEQRVNMHCAQQAKRSPVSDTLMKEE